MTPLRFRTETPVGRGILIACLVFVVLGAVAFFAAVGGTDARRTFGALIASWLFFAGLAVGGLAFAAFMQLSGARWATPIVDVARGLSRFIPVAAALLAVILVGLPIWAPWYHHVPAQQQFWFSTPVLLTREVIGSALLFGFGYARMRPAAGKLSGLVSVVWIMLFAAVVSMWAFDFILGPDLKWSSTLIGPHLFVGAFISAGALATVVALSRRRLDRRQRHDAGALTITVGVFWGYLFWSQFLTIWYGNLPDEIEFMIRRGAAGWQIESLLVVLCILAIPLLILLTGRAKESPQVLGFAALLQVVGLWLERHMLVVPTLSPPGATPFDLRGALVALGLLGAFVLVSWDSLRPGALPENANDQAVASGMRA